MEGGRAGVVRVALLISSSLGERGLTILLPEKKSQRRQRRRR